jgi:ubiquitin-activating enzyme E1
MNMKMSELVENVSKKPIPPWTKNLLVEVMVNDENDEDVEVSSAGLRVTMPVTIADRFQVPYCLVHI